MTVTEVLEISFVDFVGATNEANSQSPLLGLFIITTSVKKLSTDVVAPKAFLKTGRLAPCTHIRVVLHWYIFKLLCSQLELRLENAIQQAIANAAANAAAAAAAVAACGGGGGAGGGGPGPFLLRTPLRAGIGQQLNFSTK